MFVKCANYIFFIQVPQNLIRMFPDWCAELRDHPPMAHKFLLGDVLVEKSLKFKGKDYFQFGAPSKSQI